MTLLFRRAGLFCILLFWITATILSAAEKIAGTLTVHDSLTSPNQPATIEATLTWKGLLTETGLGGEPIELLVAGNVVSIAAWYLWRASDEGKRAKQVTSRA